MSFLLYPKHYKQQPQIAAKPNAAFGLVGLVLPGQTDWDLVNKTQLNQRSGTTGKNTGAYGPELVLTTNNASYYATAAPAARGLSQISLIYVGTLFTGASSNSSLGGITYDASNSAPYVCAELKRNTSGPANNVYLNYSDRGTEAQLISSGNGTQEGPVIVIATITSNKQCLYIRTLGGIFEQVISTIPGVVLNSTVTSRFEIGDSLNARNPSAHCALFGVANQAWPEELVLELLQNPWKLFAPRKIWVPGAAADGVSGTLTSTLANATLASSGSTTILGTLSRTLGNATLVSAGSTTILGSLSSTLANATLSATGSQGTAVAGSLAATLQGATLVASGNLTQVGTLSVTLAGATLAAAGTTTIVGSLTSTLADARLNSAGFPGEPPEGSFWRFLGLPLNRLGL